MTAEKRRKEQHSMSSSLRPKLSYSNVIATIALFIALGGAAVAAGLPRNSVGTNQLKRGAVTAAKLHKAAVTSGKLATKSVIAGKLGPNAVLPGNIGNGAVTSAKIGAGAVIASSIKNGVVTNNKLANEAVTTAKLGKSSVTNPILANGSVTPAKLSEEFGPIVATLRSGQTLRGIFDVGGSVAANTNAASFRASQTFQFPLLNTPVPNLVPLGTTTPACPGLGGGNVTPQAAAGQLCIYITGATSEAELSVDTGSNNRLGFGLLAKFKKAETDNFVQGLWAVTAP
jgi:hypothetical protein